MAIRYRLEHFDWRVFIFRRFGIEFRAQVRHVLRLGCTAAAVGGRREAWRFAVGLEQSALLVVVGYVLGRLL